MTIAPVAATEIDQIPRRNLLWIFFAQGISLAPLLVHLPIWIGFLWIAMLGYRLRINQGVWTFPSLMAKLVFGASCVAALWTSYGSVTAVEPMVGFLICSYSLKLVELRNNKDVFIILFIGFIAVASQFLFAQSLPSALFAIFSCAMLITAWQAALTTRSKPVGTHALNGLVLLAQSLPFMVILFVVMPRLGPLWSVPAPQGSGSTGMSDELKLGAIGELVKSREPAFRVSFDNTVPSPDLLYWRGMLLEHFDGVTWRQRIQLHPGNDRAPATPAISDELSRYSVLLEPHHGRWLFTLGIPLQVESEFLKIQRQPGQVVQSRWPVSKKSRYQVTSILTQALDRGELGQADYRAYTQLPKNANPQARALAEQWAGDQLTASAIAAQALDLFRKDFTYTLRPQTLGQDAIDQFLFETRRGFCEHFASSFVFLMRAAGVPSRIVVGYQGGEMNPVENYLLVRQSDAHAWAEIWLDDTGWVGIDPTSAVAPNRIDRGIADALDERERAMIENPWQNNGVLRRVFHQWDAMGFAWNRWVLNYDKDAQRAFLTKILGDANPLRIGLAFSVLLFTFFFIFLMVPRWRRRRAVPREVLWMRSLLKKLVAHGYAPQVDESFNQFAERVGQGRPELKEMLATVSTYYEAVVYGEKQQYYTRLRASIDAVNSRLKQLKKSGKPA